MSHRWVQAALLLIALAGCGPGRTGDESTPRVANEQDRAGIDSTRQSYVSAWKAADAEQLANLYTSDALVLYPNRPAVAGRSEIVSYFNSFFAEFSQEEFELTSMEIEVVGPWAFDRGAYRWKGIPRAGGPTIEDRGKYLVILNRQTDGSWKVARDMDNSDLPLTQATRSGD